KTIAIVAHRSGSNPAPIVIADRARLALAANGCSSAFASAGWTMSTKSFRTLVVIALDMFATLHLVAPAPSLAAGANRSAAYAGVGEEFTQYDVDVYNASLIRRNSVTLPGYVQEAWPHPSKPILYVAWSNAGPSYAGASGAAAPSGSRHGITAFKVDQTTGAL